MKRHILPLVAGAALTLSLAVPSAFAQSTEMPPTAVAVMEMKPAPLPVVRELPGRVSATRHAEVRPRIGGIVLERVFEQGSRVEAGDVLYRVDPAPFAVRVESANAVLARSQAALTFALSQERRAQTLRERNIAAGVELENAATNVLLAQADVASAEAALKEAQMNLDYTDIRAPIRGIIGRANVTEGALVTAQTDVMATIQQLDPVYVDFTQPSSELLRLRRAMEAGELVAVADNEARVHLVYDDGTKYEHPGRLLFSEAAVDSLTGQVTLRGEFPNPEGNLLPGLYVRIVIEQAILQNALAVPQMAVQRDAQGNALLYVVNAEGVAEARPVTLGAALGTFWVVETGVQPGEKVVVEGAQKLFPGAQTAPEPWAGATAAQQAN